MTPLTVACQTALSTGFSWQEYWTGLPFLSPGDLPNPGVELTSPVLAGRFLTACSPGKTWTISEELLTIMSRTGNMSSI